MTKTQKIIKYFAIGLATFIIFSIFSLIVYGFITIGNMFSDTPKIEGLKTVDADAKYKYLDIEVSTVNVTFRVKPGLYYTIETNNKNLEFKENGDKLTITEDKFNFLKTESTDLVISIPSNFVFDTVELETGFGKVNLESLSTNYLKLDLGTGLADISNLYAFKRAEIDGGAGEININSSNINNFDLDMGLGKLNLSANLTGNSNIDCGIGEVNVKLIGNDYKIKVDKGIGNVSINGSKMDTDSYGNGLNNIDISGGIGNINIEYVDFN